MNKAFEKILERLEEHFNCTDNRYMRLAYHHAMKSVKEVAEEYKGGWISCSERMPEETHKQYLVTYREVNFGEFYYSTDITYLSTLYDGKKSWEIEEEDMRKKVVAWMPLPEPYTEK